MPISFTAGSATISTTEWSLPANASGPTSQTTQGVFSFFIDLGALTSGETYAVRLYEKHDGTGTQRLIEEWVLSGLQGSPMFVIPAQLLGSGWDVTMVKLAGTDRTINWSIRRIY